MWQGGGDFPLEWLDLIGWGEENGRKRKEKEEKKRKKKRRVRSSNFSIEFVVIGPSVLVIARGQVGPRNER